jgi:hypothetical protein
MNPYYKYAKVDPNIPTVRAPIRKFPPSEMGSFVLGYRFAFVGNSELVPTDSKQARLFYWGMLRAQKDSSLRRSKGKRTALMVAAINRSVDGREG